MEITRPTKDSICYRANSWMDFVDYAKTAKSPLAEVERLSRISESYKRQNRGGKGWYGTEDMADAFDKATNGWMEAETFGKTYSMPIVDRITNKITKEDISHDVEGAGIDIARFLDGEPECWQKFSEREDLGYRVIKMVYNIACLSDVNFEDIQKKGAIVCSLIECMEYAGFRVELTVAMSTDASYGVNPAHIDMLIPVKAADQPIDMAKLMFAVGNASVQRRLGFAIRECMPTDMIKKFDLPNSYGISAESTEKGDVYLSHGIVPTKKIERWILDQLSKQGVKFHE